MMEDVINLMGIKELTISYGMTETSPTTFLTRPEDTFGQKTSTVGSIMPYTEGKIVGEDGSILPRNEKGEVLTRGYCIMKGYWGDIEATKASIDEDGWMHTGDIGIVDDEGYLQIVGRLKDMIIRGGENIYPKEIEEYLLRNESVENVQIFGFPDKKMGEEVFAWIKVREGRKMTKEDVLEYCKGKIAHYKIPKYVKFVDCFPITVTGKP